MKNGKSGWSLKVKLITLSLGITFALGATSIGVLQYLANTQEQDHRDAFAAFANTVGDAIAAQFYERYGDVQAFAFNPVVKSNDQKEIIDALNTYSAMYGIYDLIMVVGADGRLVAVNSKDPAGKDINVKSLYSKNYSKTPWFQAVMEGKTTDDKDKGFSGTYVETVQLDPYTTQVWGENRLGSSFSAPVKDDKGNTIGVVTNRAGSRWFEVALREAYENMRDSGYSHTELTLLDKDGTLLFHYTSNPANKKLDDSKYNWDELLKVNYAQAGHLAAKEAIAGKVGALIEKDKEHGERIVGYSPVDNQKFIGALGWATLAADSRAEVLAQLNHAKIIFYSIFSLIIFGSCFGAYYFSVSLSKQLTTLADQLSKGSGEVSSAAAAINTSSVDLSEAATEQAAAIQETAASIDEVSAMVKKSADNASQSQAVSKTSKEAAEGGQTAIQEMVHAINEINQSNTAIMNQVEEGNRQISEIVKVISEIGNKTKVINDIVFQTKLLSFNASVEAARAGEHGKGFGVVAEEVGNLAQMSGNAAKEISSMLEGSIQKVEGIVNETKSKVERLVVEGKSKVEAGTKIAQRCGESLTHILTSVHDVDGMVGEIASASREQSQGVSEINKAMNQLDQVTQKNTQVAQQAATSSEQLNRQAKELKQMVQDLFVLINGVPTSSAPPTQNQPPVQESNVVHLKTKPKPENTTPSKPLKKAAGAELASAPSQVPANDDPRFEDL